MGKANDRLVADRYEKMECLSSGGKGYVFKAKDLKSDGSPIVVMRLAPLNNDRSLQLIGKLEREITALKQGQGCQGINKILDEGDDGNVRFVVTRFLDGKTLRQHLQERRAKSENQKDTEWLDLHEKIAIVLDDIHKNGLVHRNLKPEHIIIQPGGEIFLIDFSVASIRGNLLEADSSNFVDYTSAYLAPELRTNEDTQTQHKLTVDIYSFGIITYEMLEGRRPFKGAKAPSLLSSHTGNHKLEFNKTTQDYSNKIADVVRTALSLYPNYRHKSAINFHSVLAKKIRDHDNKIGAARERVIAIIGVIVAILGLILTAITIYLAIIEIGLDTQSSSSFGYTNTPHIIVSLPKMASPNPTAANITNTHQVNLIATHTPVSSATSTSSPSPTLDLLTQTL